MNTALNKFQRQLVVAADIGSRQAWTVNNIPHKVHKEGTPMRQIVSAITLTYKDWAALHCWPTAGFSLSDVYLCISCMIPFSSKLRHCSPYTCLSCWFNLCCCPSKHSSAIASLYITFHPCLHRCASHTIYPHIVYDRSYSRSLCIVVNSLVVTVTRSPCQFVLCVFVFVWCPHLVCVPELSLPGLYNCDFPI